MIPKDKRFKDNCTMDDVREFNAVKPANLNLRITLYSILRYSVMGITSFTKPFYMKVK